MSLGSSGGVWGNFRKKCQGKIWVPLPRMQSFDCIIIPCDRIKQTMHTHIHTHKHSHVRKASNHPPVYICISQIWRTVPNTCTCTLTNRGDKQVSDFLAAVPFSHTRRQRNLEHGVALRDLPDSVKYRPDLPRAQDAWISFHQWSVVFLVRLWEKIGLVFFFLLLLIRAYVCVRGRVLKMNQRSTLLKLLFFTAA